MYGREDVSKERIGVEHSIGGVKVSGIVHAVYRNFREGFEDLVPVKSIVKKNDGHV